MRRIRENGSNLFPRRSHIFILKRRLPHLELTPAYTNLLKGACIRPQHCRQDSLWFFVSEASCQQRNSSCCLLRWSSFTRRTAFGHSSTCSSPTGDTNFFRPNPLAVPMLSQFLVLLLTLPPLLTLQLAGRHLFRLFTINPPLLVINDVAQTKVKFLPQAVQL